jgi:hypothetical protein
MVGAFGNVRVDHPEKRRGSPRVAGLGAAIVLALAVAGPASAWPQMDWPQTNWGRVVSTLKQIPAAGGENAFGRMKACRLKFDRTRSWIEDAQLTQKRGKPGDRLLQVTFEAPKMPGRKTRMSNLIAQWYIPKGGQPTPWGPWADKIQNADQVMWLHC